jgi:histidinol dehydrogenase
MTVVPAQVAGVPEIAVVSPPRHEGSIHPVILAVCHELGVEEVYRIGGVQAVGALAVGHRAFARWTSSGRATTGEEARELLRRLWGDRLHAGTSEVLIIAIEQAVPDWVRPNAQSGRTRRRQLRMWRPITNRWSAPS